MSVTSPGERRQERDWSVGADQGPPLSCPACGAPVRFGLDQTSLSCPVGHPIDVVAGVPDLRGDLAGFDRAADAALAETLANDRDAGFEELLRAYWSRQPDVAGHLVARFVRGDVIGGSRASEVAEQVLSTGASPADPRVALEVGAGSGALGSALAGTLSWVVVSDVSIAWLVLARRRLRDAGIANVSLVAAAADQLPFAARTFDLVVAADVIEHVPDQRAMVEDCVRVLSSGGRLWLSTPNRLSLTPEPHVRVWGVGWLPRSAGIALVERVRGIDYRDIRTLSLWGLRRVLDLPATTTTITVPRIAEAVRAGYTLRGRVLIDLFHLLRVLPGVRWLLRLVTPLFHATVTRTA